MRWFPRDMDPDLWVGNEEKNKSLTSIFFFFSVGIGTGGMHFRLYRE